MSKNNKSYSHYIWNPFANFDFHLIIFKKGKTRPGLVWKRVFGIDEDVKRTVSNYGLTYFDKQHRLTKVAVSLTVHEGNFIDIQDIVHETNHSCDEIFQICDMKFGSEYGSSEFRSYLSGSIVSKICQICKNEGINITFDKFDFMKLNNIIKLT